MDVIVPTVGTISQCANEPSYQLAIQTEGMVKDIVQHLAAEVSMSEVCPSVYDSFCHFY